MNDNKRLIEVIAWLGEKFLKEHLNPENFYRRFGVNIRVIRENVLEALKFFLSRVLFQRRKDEISYRVYVKIKDILESHKENLTDLEKIKNELNKQIGRGKVGRKMDVQIVIETLRYFGERNIVAYAYDKIKAGEISMLFKEIQKICGVGDKTASLFIRDLIMIYRELLNVIKKKDVKFILPVDTWVRKGLKILFNINYNDPELKEKILKLCGYSIEKAINFNAGLWYLGKHPFEAFKHLINKIT